MNSLKLTLLFFTCIIISCTSKVEQYVLKVKIRHLTPENIYNANMVNDILFDAEELDKDSLRTKSHELFLSGIDLIKNKKQLKEGIELLKKSIMVFPDPKCYYELANALAESGSKENMEESLLSYDIAKSLEYKPVSYVYVRKAAVANSLAEMDNERKEQFKNDAVFYLREAFRSGLSDTSFINKEDRLRSIIKGPEYKSMLINASLSNSGGPGGLLKLFIESFPGPVSSYEIDADHVDITDNAELVNYEFAGYIPEMENASFGRDVSRDFFYVTRLQTNGNYNAVIYASVSFMGEKMQPVYTTLATFDNTGKTISRKLVSCQCSSEKIRTLKYQDNMIEVTDYKRSWEYPITEVSFDENKVKSLDKLASATLRILETGEIIEESNSGNLKDPETAMNLQ